MNPSGAAPESAPAAVQPGTRTGGRAMLRWLHAAAGAAGLAAFLLTGQYMDLRLDHLAGMPDAPRALYRSSHIYILFSALLNAVLGSYFALSSSRRIRAVQYVGSAFVLAALPLFVYGFIVETPAGVIERPMIRTAIELSFGGVLLHAIAGLGSRSASNRGHTAER